MSTTVNRERWTDGKQNQMYEKYFTPLLTDSSLQYLEALYQQHTTKVCTLKYTRRLTEIACSARRQTAASYINNRQRRSSGFVDTPTL